jgi:plastocyanin
MRADVSRTPGSRGRLLASVCVLSILGAACNTIPAGEVNLTEGRGFLAMVPDSVDDVGLHPSVAVDENGVPYVIYFGFPDVLAPGEIPVSRPIGAPYLTTEGGDPAGAVLLASRTPDTQVWNRGAVAQPRETPAAVSVPFRPAALPSLRSLTPSNAAGADVAVAGTDIHATWAADTGLWYGVGPDFELQQVHEGVGVGAPSIAVGDDGAPLIAYTVAAARPEVRVAELVGERWTSTVVATLSQCPRECPPATQLAILGGEPLVTVGDPSTGEVVAARRSGDTWSTEVIATDAAGGASLSAAGDTAAVAYYTEGGVAVATGGPDGGWTTEEVASVTPSPEPSPSPSPTGGESPSPAAEEPIPTEPTTGVGVDGEGRLWVSWEDASGVHLASSGEDGGFQQQDIGGAAEGGVTPSLAVTEDGASAYLAWFDPVTGDLFVGVSAELSDVLLAAPSPTPPLAGGGAPGPGGCEPDGTTLEITAEGTAFDTNCLAAPAETPFEIVFNNEGQLPHNVAIYTDSTAAETLFQGETFTGPDEMTYDVDPQPEGDYFFRCDVHPDTMTGTFVVAGGGGGGGGGQGGGGQGGTGGQGGGGGNGGGGGGG